MYFRESDYCLYLSISVLYSIIRSKIDSPIYHIIDTDISNSHPISITRESYSITVEGRSGNLPEDRNNSKQNTFHKTLLKNKRANTLQITTSRRRTPVLCFVFLSVVMNRQREGVTALSLCCFFRGSVPEEVIHSGYWGWRQGGRDLWRSKMTRMDNATDENMGSS